MSYVVQHREVAVREVAQASGAEKPQIIKRDLLREGKDVSALCGLITTTGKKDYQDGKRDWQERSVQSFLMKFRFHGQFGFLGAWNAPPWIPR